MRTKRQLIEKLKSEYRELARWYTYIRRFHHKPWWDDYILKGITTTRKKISGLEDELSKYE